MTNQHDLREQLKKQLFDEISMQIDLIDYVPEDLQRMVGNYQFGSDLIVPIPETEGENAKTQLDKDELATLLNSYYDTTFYNDSGTWGTALGGTSKTDYRNIGYWDETTTNQHLASVKLQDKLLEFIPNKTGRILDAACGLGASTRHLMDFYAPENIWAINISDRQIESTKINAPGCHAQVMNAVDLTFEDNFFDAIECIEAAFHFETRKKFFQQAHRVLKDDGYLVLSDVLFTSRERLAQHATYPSPENHVESIAEYESQLAEAGFRNIIVQDVSKEVWGSHFLYTIHKIHEDFYNGRLNIVQLNQILWTYYYLNATTGLCLFACAQK